MRPEKTPADSFSDKSELLIAMNTVTVHITQVKKKKKTTHRKPKPHPPKKTHNDPVEVHRNFATSLNKVGPDAILFAEMAPQDTESHHLTRYLVKI